MTTRSPRDVAGQAVRQGWERLRDETHGPWSPHESQRAIERFSSAGRWIGLSMIAAAVGLGIALALAVQVEEEDDD